MGYDYKIEYKRVKDNSVADALSRAKTPSELLALLYPLPHWLEPIQIETQAAPKAQALVNRIQVGEAIGPWKYKDGLIFFKGCIYFQNLL